MLYFEEIEKDEYRERESKNVGPKETKVRREESEAMCAFRQQVHLAS